MKTRSTIQIFFYVLVLAVAVFSTAYSQDSIPPEKKRALHRFDPSDIFPEEREVGRSRVKKKPKNEANSADTKTRSLDLTSPEPTAAPRIVNSPAPAPTPTATAVEPTPTPEASPEATATPNNVAAAQSSPPPSAPGGSAGANQTGNGQAGSGQGFPIYFILPVLFLILFALVALIISLKKELRTP